MQNNSIPLLLRLNTAEHTTVAVVVGNDSLTANTNLTNMSLNATFQTPNNQSIYIVAICNGAENF